jgi:hypothetical protein
VFTAIDIDPPNAGPRGEGAPGLDDAEAEEMGAFWYSVAAAEIIASRGG